MSDVDREQRTTIALACTPRPVGLLDVVVGGRGVGAIGGRGEIDPPRLL